MTARMPDLPQTPVRRTWPFTLGLVALAVLLLAIDLFGAAIVTAPFFGDTPSRAEYLEAGATTISALLPLAVLTVAAWRLGSTVGVVLVLLAAAVSAFAGVSLLGETGDPTDPDPGRSLAPSDFVTNLNVFNGFVLVVALLPFVVAAVVRRRRRAGAAARGSSSTPAS
ncbi:MAG: hypothetical protein ABI083_00395 [Lapillicoccus sp.]